MYRHFPDLCRVLTSRWKAWNQKRGTDRRKQLTGEVRDIAARLHDEGTDPSTLNVARSLSQPGTIRDPAARAALREFRRHLGLEDLGDARRPEQ